MIQVGESSCSILVEFRITFWRRAVLEKLILIQLVKKCPALLKLEVYYFRHSAGMVICFESTFYSLDAFRDYEVLDLVRFDTKVVC